MKRRDFLKFSVAATAGLGIARLKSALAGPAFETLEKTAFLPLMLKTYDSNLAGRVIHVHSSSVTNWDFDPEYYYGTTQTDQVKGVSQSVVDRMVDRGLTELLGMPAETPVADTWAILIPRYSPGMTVAIKINLNNSPKTTCYSTTTAIDAIAQPINAVVRGLIQHGIREDDIIVYDAARSFSQRLYDELVYKDIQLHDYTGCYGNPCSWDSNDPYAQIQFSPPDSDPPDVKLCDTLVNANYLINMPIIKGHPLAGVTLGFKNHFGSTNTPSNMHSFVATYYDQVELYNALVDLNSNPHIRDKTVLTIADGIYGSRVKQDTPPEPWTTFEDQSPCSMFFAKDPVAIDCVQHDLLKAERGSAQPATSNAYLKLAESAGLGVYESGNPWQPPYGSGYSKIDYRRIELLG